ncbi:hypothetical protein [Terriglobus roseus]|uniref:hypothetical protein n=1 Tax=Terriglobus roseus TaxID=392734 RepID=UPI0012F650E5|nr:hypothetical protein [Terriglobus roseus]
MQYSAILREIDAELNKLLQVRKILAGTVEPSSVTPRTDSKKRCAKKIASVRRQAAKPMETATLRSLPLVPTTSGGLASIPRATVTVLPPKQKREYRRTIKAFVPEPRALAAPRSSGVVVYMAPESSTKAVATQPQSQLLSTENLEAVMRQKLLGGTNG